MKNSAIITIPSHPKYLAVLRAVTTKMGELSGMSEASIEEVRLAVDEACSNVIKYAYKGDADKKIVIKFMIKKNDFEVIIEDSGIKAVPELIKGRGLDDLKAGGLGIHLIKRAFDTFAFDDNKKKGNRLRLVRHQRADNGN